MRTRTLVTGTLVGALLLAGCGSGAGAAADGGGAGRNGAGAGAGAMAGNTGTAGNGATAGAAGSTPGTAGAAGTSTPGPLPAPSCTPAPGGGKPRAEAPVMKMALTDRFHEGWLASPSVVDLDGDGKPEILLPREQRLLAFRSDGTLAFSANVSGRIWASAVTANFVGDAALEIVVAARGNVYMFDARGQAAPGFPVAWRDEMRSLAAGDVDGDGRLEIAVATTSLLRSGGQSDVFQVLRADGSPLPGFPPNTSGTSGCTAACYLAGAFDQNLALGPLDDSGGWDILVPHDNAYMSWHKSNGAAFDSAPIFNKRPKVPGIRFLLDYAEAQMGFSETEATSNQAHFTNSPPAIADIDGDGQNEIVVLGSVQNAAQSDRERGVALWVVRPDGTRPPAWSTPHHVPDFLAGLWDFERTNVVAATNQVSIADLDPARPGLEMVFPGFDGRIHAVAADRTGLWSSPYTTSAQVLTGGVAIADLSGDGVPEIVFASYSPDAGASHLFVLGAGGDEQHQIPLPGRGAMAVPTVADVDGDGTLEIVVNLKDGEDRVASGLVFTVPGSAATCAPWPTGRGNWLRNGYLPAAAGSPPP